MIRGPVNLATFRDDDHLYVDPLPPCELAPEPFTETLKSVTRKLSDCWPFINDAWKLGHAADHAIANTHRIVEAHMAGELDPIRTAIMGAADRARDEAGARGTDVHRLLETCLDGGQFGIFDDVSPAAGYMPQIKAIAADMETSGVTVVASEVVVISRTRRYAGTFDAIWRLADGRLYIVDYKSRGEGKAANRKPSEAAQLGAYASGDYWIVDGEAGPERMAPMDLDGGLVVSIAPDRTAYYEVRIDDARASWTHCLDWLAAKADVVKAFHAPTTLDRVGVAKADKAARKPRTKPARIEPVVVDAWTPPDEGDALDVEVTKDKLTELRARLELDTVSTKVLTEWVSEGDRASRPWRIREIATVRRRAIYGAAIRLVAWDDLTDDNAAVLVGLALGEELQPGHKLGAALGCLTFEQARTLASLVDLLLEGAELTTVVAA